MLVFGLLYFLFLFFLFFIFFVLVICRALVHRVNFGARLVEKFVFHYFISFNETQNYFLTVARDRRKFRYLRSLAREAGSIVKCSFDDESFSDLFFSRPGWWKKPVYPAAFLGACLLRSTKMTTLGYTFVIGEQRDLTGTSSLKRENERDTKTRRYFVLDLAQN